MSEWILERMDPELIRLGMSEWILERMDPELIRLGMSEWIMERFHSQLVRFDVLLSQICHIDEDNWSYWMYLCHIDEDNWSYLVIFGQIGNVRFKVWKFWR